MTELIAQDIEVKIKGEWLLRPSSFKLSSGDLTVVLGPNGAGKTSLLRASLGICKTTGGQSRLDGQDISAVSTLKRAQSISYLPQTRPLAWPNRVKDIVAMGRFAHGVNISRLEGEDALAVQRALELCDLTHLQTRKADSLSGGEQARMHLARAFSARSPLLVVDEPVAALDPRHQFRVMDIIRDYVDGGGGALVVLHDVSLAAKYADRLIWMKDGEIVAKGTVAETLSERRLADIYRVRSIIKGSNVQITGV